MRVLTYAIALFVSVSFSKVYAQRCGGFVAFTFVDSTENLKYPISFPKNQWNFLDDGRELDCDVIYKVGGLEIKILDDRPGKDCIQIGNDYDMPVYHMPAGCGFKVRIVLISRNEKQMRLNVKNAWMEMEYFVDSIPFLEGEFTIDLETATRMEGSTSGYVVHIPGWGNIIRSK